MSTKNDDVIEVYNRSSEMNNTGGRTRSYKNWLIGILALLVIGGLVGSGIWSRVTANAKLRTETSQVALTAVSVVSPQRTTPAEENIPPGNVQPYITSPNYSRTNWYLQKLYFDIGAHVKKGELLAVIE